MKNNAFKIIEALKWFYENELIFSKLRSKESLTDTENIKYLQLKSRMETVLSYLQNELQEPCETIIAEMELRLKNMEKNFKKYNKKLAEEYKKKGVGGWNHIFFLQKAIPRLKLKLKCLNKACTILEKIIAIDLIINEWHWGYPMIVHITRNITPNCLGKKEKEKFLSLSKEVINLRNSLCKKGKCYD